MCQRETSLAVWLVFEIMNEFNAGVTPFMI
jgi:hypothetical protein